MEDVFNEQLVKKIPSKTDRFKKAGLVIFGVVVFFVALQFLASLALFIGALLGYGIYYLFTFFSVEYEYIFTNGDLDIDCIYNKMRRKRMGTIVVKEIEVMAHIDDKNHTGDFSRAMETKDYSSGVPKENTYCFLVNEKGKAVKYIIEPNEALLNGFSRYLTPRKLFLKK